ncbi:hypothetical protein OG21DRAFT_563253 [Imleria badia]|nr:hypothetical protein OG21DRAFT_563253 [Imleria badia]
MTGPIPVNAHHGSLGPYDFLGCFIYPFQSNLPGGYSSIAAFPSTALDIIRGGFLGESLESVSRVGYKNVTLHRQLCHTRLTSCFRHYYGGVPSQTRLTSRPLTWFHAFHSVILTPQGKLAAMRHSIWSPLAWPTTHNHESPSMYKSVHVVRCTAQLPRVVDRHTTYNPS